MYLISKYGEIYENFIRRNANIFKTLVVDFTFKSSTIIGPILQIEGLFLRGDF